MGLPASAAPSLPRSTATSSESCLEPLLSSAKLRYVRRRRLRRGPVTPIERVACERLAHAAHRRNTISTTKMMNLIEKKGAGKGRGNIIIVTTTKICRACSVGLLGILGILGGLG